MAHDHSEAVAAEHGDHNHHGGADESHDNGQHTNEGGTDEGHHESEITDVQRTKMPTWKKAAILFTLAFIAGVSLQGWQLLK